MSGQIALRPIYLTLRLDFESVTLARGGRYTWQLNGYRLEVQAIRALESSLVLQRLGR